MQEILVATAAIAAYFVLVRWVFPAWGSGPEASRLAPSLGATT